MQKHFVTDWYARRTKCMTYEICIDSIESRRYKNRKEKYYWFSSFSTYFKMSKAEENEYRKI